MPPSSGLTLVIANKNYSSWSARPWLVMTELAIPFAERMVKFDSADWNDNIATLSPSGLVPVLWEGEPASGFATFDTIAIVERLHELFPGAGVWPGDPQARSRARSARSGLPCGLSAPARRHAHEHPQPPSGEGDSPEVRAGIDELCANWRETRARFGGEGPFLFGDFCAADACFTPVVSRFVTCDVALPGDAKRYQDALLGTRAMRAWTEAALEETEFVPMDEPYASPPD